MASSTRKGILLLGTALGLVAFLAGLALAESYLPEWRQERPLGETAYRQRYRELAARAGFTLAPGEPEAVLLTRGPEQMEPYRALGDEGSRWLLATRSAVRVEVVHGVTEPGSEGSGVFAVDFSFSGEPQLLTWWGGFVSPYGLVDPGPALRHVETLAPLLLARGETLGTGRTDTIVTLLRILYPLKGGRLPQHLQAFVVGGYVFVGRGARDLAHAVGTDDFLARPMTLFWKLIPCFLALAILFATLLLRRRISLRNGFLLALGGLATLRPAPGILTGPPWMFPAVAVGLTALLFLLWSSAESLYRSNDAGFTTSLDALLAGRLGPRSGRGLLIGFACGAGLAGLRLALCAATEPLPGV
ncbi:MAG TPA: hypothetical protein VF173_02770, partial [Thermoanaerobaculia bacterium]|nr:hypothetical protein [Thermoanaerobaculia bacterium]